MRSLFRWPLAAFVLLLAVTNLADDHVARRTPVPDAERPQGEVRILRRDASTVVQTLVHSRVVRRMAGEIAKKERQNWEEGRDGFADSERFVAALAELARRVRDTEAPGEDRRRGFCLEFPSSGPVTLSAALVERRDEGLRLVERREPSFALELGPSYVERNRVLIVIDAFSVDEPTAQRWLGSDGT
jgi:hypothetical protein